MLGIGDCIKVLKNTVGEKKKKKDCEILSLEKYVVFRQEKKTKQDKAE